MSALHSIKRAPLVLNASSIARAHTILAAVSFLTAFIVGCLFHYKKIVQNGVAGYPQEWFPSVSATIGDWYPERNLFQILIALTSGPRFLLVAMQYYCHKSERSSLPDWVFVSGIARTFACGGWVYITSNDDHDAHDVFMISYIVCNLPWMLGGIACTPLNKVSIRRKRKYIATTFFATLIPLVYFFIQHKVHKIPGAYTHYAFFEWSLILLDVLFDSVTELEFRDVQLKIVIGTRLQTPSIDDEVGLAAHINTKGDVKVASSTAVLGQDAGLVDTVSSDWKTAASFISDVYLSYVFWSIFTALLPTLFYFSIWELGIAGQELALLTTLSPVLLCSASIRNVLQTKPALLVLHVFSFSGLLAFTSDNPLYRLFVISFAVSVSTIRQVLDWSGLTGSNVTYQALVAALGLIVSSLSKHANHSNNPIWPFVGQDAWSYNRIGLTFAIIALSEHFLRNTHQTNQISRLVPAIKTRTMAAALPLGSLLFTLMNLLADSSTLIAWSWTGYENGVPRGPSPHLHGSFTFVAQGLGLLLPPVLTNHIGWLFYGAAGAFVLHQHRNWLGYVGGLNFTVFLMSIIPIVFQRAAATQNPALTYFIAMVIYCLLQVAGVFTVAYAFVPGGEYFRERTHLLLLTQLICLIFAFPLPGSSSLPVRHSLPSWARTYTRRCLMLTTLSPLLVTLYRWPPAPSPLKQGPRIINAGIWTVHFGFNNIGRDSQQGIKNLISDMQLDVVGLLETDLHKSVPVLGNVTCAVHQPYFLIENSKYSRTRLIVEELGFNVDFGPGPNSHTWGAVLLSKFPIITSTHHLLPSPDGELAPAIEAVLNVYGTEVTVVVSHNGQEETPLDRELQSKELARIMSTAYPRPVIFLGYVVTEPHAERPAPYKYMVEDGRVYDIDKDDMDRWCQYIFYRGLYRTAYARISRGVITDTEMQIGQFMLPRYGYSMTNETEAARYLRASKEQLPAGHWFPSEYLGNEHEGGKNGHFYHVFGSPLYYAIPEGATL